MGWMAKFANRQRSRCLAKGKGSSLYRLPGGEVLWLDEARYLDRCLIRQGVFEPASTDWVKRLLGPGDCVLDVGANIGYYSVLFARQVSETGHVIAFEPTAHYRELLVRNLQENHLQGRVTVLPYGLSRATQSMNICFGECSATLHWVEQQSPSKEEQITLHALDEIWPELGLKRLDFVKVDIDGHEPAFIQGAERTIQEYQPILLLEVNHANYLAAGWPAWDFYDHLKERGWRLYSEKTGQEFGSRLEFLRECGNFDRSANLLVATGTEAVQRLEGRRGKG